MIKKLVLCSLCLVSFNLAFSADLVKAQEEQTFVPPGSQWVNKAQEHIKILNQQSMEKEGGVTPQELHLSIVRYSYMEPEQFGILMKTPEIVTGCFEISPIGYEAKFIGDLYMDINVSSYTVKPIKTQKVEYACNKGYRAATGMILLNSEDLKNCGTRQLRFSNGAARDNYKISFENDKIILTPESMLVFKTKNSNLTYDKNGAVMVALEVPMAKEGDNIAQSVRTIAAKNGLNPVTDISLLPQSTSPKPNIFYYIDELGRFTDAVNENGYAELGVIPASRVFIDENGKGQKPVPLKVFVKKI